MDFSRSSNKGTKALRPSSSQVYVSNGSSHGYGHLSKSSVPLVPSQIIHIPALGAESALE